MSPWVSIGLVHVKSQLQETVKFRDDLVCHSSVSSCSVNHHQFLEKEKAFPTQFDCPLFLTIPGKRAGEVQDILKRNESMHGMHSKLSTSNMNVMLLQKVSAPIHQRFHHSSFEDGPQLRG